MLGLGVEISRMASQEIARCRRLSQDVARCRKVSQDVAQGSQAVERRRMVSQDVAGCHEVPQPQERSHGYRGNVYFLLKLNFRLVSDHPESGRSETQLGIECLGRGAIVALPQVGRVRGDQ